ncbi:T9SS type A sorting domain-containing protein [Flavobacteriaceae bacterium]|nr:T9SS type A sorting domain-containing protein [Flavobacteriaceae bacterium]
MKKIYLLFLFLLSFFFINSQTVINHSFDLNDGITGWTNHNAMTDNHDNTEGKTSAGSIKLVGNSNANGHIKTTFTSTFETGATVRIMFWAKSSTAGVRMKTAYTLGDTKYPGWVTLTNANTWYLYSAAVAAASNDVGDIFTLKIFGDNSVLDATYWVDDVVVIGSVNNQWDGSESTAWETAANWSAGTVPTNHTRVLIPTSGITNWPVISSAAKAGSIRTYNGANLTINAGVGLTVSGNIQPAGNIILNSTSNSYASLKSHGFNSQGEQGTADVSSTAVKLKYNRYVNGVGSPGWDMIGSPLAGEAFSDITSSLAISGNMFGVGPYNNSNNTFATYTSVEATSAGTMTSGQGFQMSTSSGTTVPFVGTYNMGDVTYSITNNNGGSGTQWNLVSNPYPSYICLNLPADTASSDASQDFLTYNTATSDVLGDVDSEEAVYAWGGSSYTTINQASAAYIAPGQGFFVSSKSGGGTLNFKRAMQTTLQNGDDFISGDTTDPDRAELFISLNQNSIERQTKLFFIENMTDDLDPGYDAAVFELQDNPIYTRLVSEDEGIDMSIQSLNFTEINDKVIPLGINAESGTEATISISHNTTNPSTYVYLEDALEGTFTNLKETDFVITLDSDLEGIGRFFIHTSSTTMSNEDTSTNLLNVFKLDRNNFITVEGLATESNQTNLKLYNILGKEVLSTTLANNTNTQTISTEGLSAGIYVIKLESGNNLLTKKLIIK